MRIIAALSGGVESSVAAARMVDQGHEVVGVHLALARAESAGCHACENLLNLARMCDVISVNVAANQETHHLISAEFLAAMKPGAIIVNTSRGSVIDQDSLAEAIRDKGIRAGLDVFADEPGSGTGEFTDQIAGLPGVYGTHHVGASTDQAQAAKAEQATLRKMVVQVARRAASRR